MSAKVEVVRGVKRRTGGAEWKGDQPQSGWGSSQEEHKEIIAAETHMWMGRNFRKAYAVLYGQLMISTFTMFSSGEFSKLPF